MATQPNFQRQRLYTLLAVGNTWCRENVAGWSDEIYRELLRAHGAAERNGQPSASSLAVVKLEAVLEHLKAKGFKPTRKGPAGNLAAQKKALHNKLTACWCALADNGVIQNRNEQAMHSFLFRFGGNQLQWVTPAQYNKAIEACKDMARRKGVLDANGDIRSVHPEPVEGPPTTEQPA